MNLKKTVFQNTSAIIAGRVVSLLLSVVSSVLLVRYLGSERLGQYASLYAYLTLFACLTTFGTEQILVRESVKHPEKKDLLFSTVAVISSVFSVIAAILAIAISITFGYAEGIHLLLFIAVIDLLLLAPLRLPLMIFQVNLKQWYVASIVVARQILWIVAVSALILLHANLVMVILGRLFCSFAEVIAIFYYGRKFISFKWRWDGLLAKAILISSLPIGLSALSGSIYSRIDQVMLNILTGNRQLGYYAAAVNISELFRILAVALMATMYTVLSRIVLQQEKFRAYLKLCFRYLMSFSFGLCAFITISSSLVVKLLYGGEYSNNSSAVLAILIWAEIGQFSGIIIANGLLARGLEKYIFISTFLGALSNIAFNLLFIPRWGAMGAAWATLISYNLAGFFLFFIFSDTRDLCFMGLKASFAPFLISLFLVMVLSPLPHLASVALAPILYAGGLYIFGLFKKEDLRLMAQVFAKDSDNN